MKTKLQIVTTLAASLFSMTMQAQAPALTEQDDFGGASVDATRIIPSSYKDYTLEVNGIAGQLITVESGKYTYTPTATGKVRFVKSSGTIYVYEGHSYMGTITPTTPDAPVFPNIYSATDDATAKTGIYDASNIIQNPGFETLGDNISGTTYYKAANWDCTGYTNKSYRARDAGSVNNQNAEGSEQFYLHASKPTLSQAITINPFSSYKVEFATWAADGSGYEYDANVGTTAGDNSYLFAKFYNTATIVKTNRIRYDKSYSFTTDNISDATTAYFSIVATNTGQAYFDRMTLVAATSEPRGITGIDASTTKVTYLSGAAYAPTFLKLDEGTAYTTTPATSTTGVTLNRTLKGGKWNTICLPFAMTQSQLTTTFGSDVKVAEFAGYDVDGTTLSFATVISGTAANTPYLIFPSADGTVYTVDNATIDASATPLTVTKNNVDFIGNYAVATVPLNSYFISDNKFYKAASANSAIKAFRAYFTNNNASGAKELSIDIDGQTTSIDALNTDDVAAPANVYNMNGQLVRKSATSLEGLQKGIYLMNGKRAIVK